MLLDGSGLLWAGVWHAKHMQLTATYHKFCLIKDQSKDLCQRGTPQGTVISTWGRYGCMVSVLLSRREGWEVEVSFEMWRYRGISGVFIWKGVANQFQNQQRSKFTQRMVTDMSECIPRQIVHLKDTTVFTQKPVKYRLLSIPVSSTLSR